MNLTREQLRELQRAIAHAAVERLLAEARDDRAEQPSAAGAPHLEPPPEARHA